MAETVTTPVTADVYVEVQQFYARQMRLLDGNDFAAFGATFTEDAVFTPAGVATLEGPALISKAAEAAAGRFDGGQPRHWFDMLTVESGDDTALHTAYYAVVSITSADGSNRLEQSVTVQDVLVRTEAGLRTGSRVIRRDDHSAAEAAG
ncbi:nuclear transport factor 2 family protein [Streptomyces sp. NPDC090301]|uniref:nuclear transport factor 2 family protein n=1 Tax=Streptomyces sp. NPDC090301 TaxID=3154975 RepID=UPI0034183C7E